MKRTWPATLLVLLPLAGCTRQPADTNIGSLGKRSAYVEAQGADPYPRGDPQQTTRETVTGQRKQVDDELSRMERELQTLKERAQAAGEQARQRLQPTMTALEKQIAAARQRLKALGEQGENAWQAARPSVDRAMQDLRDAFRKAANQFRSK
jgi:TolA-binding protein